MIEKWNKHMSSWKTASFSTVEFWKRTKKMKRRKNWQTSYKKKASVQQLKCIAKDTTKPSGTDMFPFGSFFRSLIRQSIWLPKKRRNWWGLHLRSQLLSFGCNIQYPTLYVGPKVGSANSGELIHVEPWKMHIKYKKHNNNAEKTRKRKT